MLPFPDFEEFFSVPGVGSDLNDGGTIGIRPSPLK